MNQQEADIKSLVELQRKHFSSGATRSRESRAQALSLLYQMVLDNEKAINDALFSDLSKSPQEAYQTETGMVLQEIRYQQKTLHSNMKNKKVHTALAQFPASAYRSPEPYGLVLVMAPWNYPFQLSVLPLAGALAAGNCVILKPSATAPATSNLLAKLIEKIFPKELLAVVQGGRQENQHLLAQRFDKIFFTGSVAVGKVVMEAASKHLTPVTLELGGKSPVIVDETADLPMAARRIAFGKLINAGQTCVAPDYLLVHQTVKDSLMNHLIGEIEAMLPNDSNYGGYANIINNHHLERLKGLLTGGKLLYGGQVEGSRMLPALVEITDASSPLMQEEIFGPILPIISFRDFDEALSIPLKLEKPLASYLFSQNPDRQQHWLQTLSFGGGCINDTVMHFSNHHLPFGGVGNSGMGSYHGKQSFATFSHYRSVLQKYPWPDLTVRYKPHKPWKDWLTRRLLR